MFTSLKENGTWGIALSNPQQRGRAEWGIIFLGDVSHSRKSMLGLTDPLKGLLGGTILA